MEKISYSFCFSAEKNHALKATRGVSFEEVLVAIQNDKLIKIIEHPNKAKYPNQKIYIVSLNDYIFLVPFVITGHEIFLKTIIPSRKETKKYIERSHNNVSKH